MAPKAVAEAKVVGKAGHPPLFYGWVIVAVSAITVAVGYGVRSSFPRFFLVMVDDFEWSRAVASGVFSINIATYGLAAPWVGAITDRLGPKKVVTTGALLLALAAILASRGNNPWHFYLLWMFIALGSCLVGYVPHSVVLTNWFVRRRGAAMGLLSVGFGFSSFSPFLTQLIISGFSWRIAYLFWGLAVLGIIVPLALVFQRRHPQDMGLFPDGRVSQAGEGSAPDATIVDAQWVATDWTLGRALRRQRFWTLFLAAFFFWGIAFIILMTHMVALIVDAGYGKLFATLVFALFGAMGILGPLGGFISDRIGREVTATLGGSLMVIGMLLLLLVRDTSMPWLLYLFAIVFGLGWGLNSPTIGAIAADLFQGRSFGAINGFIVAGFGLGGALGSYLGGLIHDLTGSYDLALLVVILAILVAISLIWVAAPRKVRSVAGRAQRLAPANLGPESQWKP